MVCTFQVTIRQKSADSQSEEHLSLRPTKLRPAGKIRGLQTIFSDAECVLRLHGFTLHLMCLKLF